MDFMADRLDDGRRIRILTVEDVLTRECLAVEVDTSLPSGRVVEVLTRLVAARGAPTVITVDNGFALYSRTTDSWAYQQGVRLDLSRPRETNGFRSSRASTDGSGASTWMFSSVRDARTTLQEWRRDDNEVRPHSALGHRPPREFAAARQSTRTAGGEILHPQTA